jgi:xanthine dehydrogenase molybdenum-binding subunit
VETVGKNVPRLDGVGKVTGRIRYVDDIFVPHMLHAKILRSSIASGRVINIDTSKAQALPGVEAVVTYKDVPNYRFSSAGNPWAIEPERRSVADRLILTGTIRYWGEEIAAVIARDELTAEKALRLINVEYEEYPPVLSAQAALAEGAPEIYAGTKNVFKKTRINNGDIEEAFSKADCILESKFKTSIVQHCAMENHSSFAYIDTDGRIVVYSSTQIPHICRRVVAQALGIKWGRVKIVKPHVGGGFGGKQDVVLEPLVAFLSTQVDGRPVKLELTREETFIGTRTRHSMEYTLKYGVAKDGTLVARKGQILSVCGAYASRGHIIANKCANMMRIQYTQQAYDFEATTVYANLPSAAAMRGYGAPQMNFALESHMEDLARAIGMDSIDFRLKNFHAPGYTDPVYGLKAYTNGLRQCLEKGRELINWDTKKAMYRNQKGLKRRGVGLASFYFPITSYPALLEVGGARIILNQDGTIQLQIGACEIGQGSDTALGQIAAEGIGIPLEWVNVVSEQDTDVSPYDTAAYASRQTYISGMAVKKAADEVKEKLIERGARMVRLPAQAIGIVEGWLINKDSRERLIAVTDVALDSYYNLLSSAPITADVSSQAHTNCFAYGCSFVEVEVDIPTGKVEVLEIYNIHDSGKIVNPGLAEGQVHGGISMGLGFALYEQMLFDPKSGKPLNNNLLDYKLMTAADTPKLEAAFVETNEPTGPYGVKGLGEPPTVTQAAAVRNAILDATGVRLYELPMTPQRLFEKFKEANLI